MFFSKFKPLSGVPAGTELFTSGVAFFSATLAAFFSIAGLGAGVSGALNGCAAEVDVAAGGVCDNVGEPWRGVGIEAEEIGVAFASAADEEKVRRVVGRRVREAHRQVRQIIAGCMGAGGVVCRVAAAIGTSGNAPSRFSAFRRGRAKRMIGQNMHRSSLIKMVEDSNSNSFKSILTGSRVDESRRFVVTG